MTLPIWFRAYVFIPILASMYVVIPIKWNFSPHVLTNTMPNYLIGATDWGVSNIYAFTKIACWISMIFGSLANTLYENPDNKGIFSAIMMRLELNAWHFGAAIFLFLSAMSHMNGGVNFSDMLHLAGYAIFVSLIGIVWIAVSETIKIPKTIRVSTAVAAAIGWGFVRVSVGNP